MKNKKRTTELSWRALGLFVSMYKRLCEFYVTVL